MRPFKHVYAARLMFALLALMLSACNAQATPEAVQVAATTDTPPPTDTPAPIETPTVTLTFMPTVTATFTPTPTATDTPTPSITPTVTKTRTPWPTFTPLPTATDTPNPRPVAPVLPNTPIWGWDIGHFIRMLRLTHGSYENFHFVMSTIVASGAEGNCYTFLNSLKDWTTALGFTDVPDAWYPLYYEYRLMLQQAVSVTEPINTACTAGGGKIPDETDQLIISTFDSLKNRSLQMISEAEALAGK